MKSSLQFEMFWPSKETLRMAGKPLFPLSPVIFNSDGEICPIPTEFLALRTRFSKNRNEAAGKRIHNRRILTTKSRRDFGECIINFYEWLAATEKSWATVAYASDILEGYQADMTSGAWSKHGTELAPNTINLRVLVACDFLSWAANKGYRGDFQVDSERRLVRMDSGRTTRGNKSIEVESRIGVVRKNPLVLNIPKDSEIKKWINSVGAHRGAVKRLMCETILNTAIRLSEAAHWRPDTLPIDRDSWMIENEVVIVDIKYGAKGQKYIDSLGDEVGPTRKIEVPLQFANRLEEYRTYVRPRLMAMYVKAGGNSVERKLRKIEASKHLFLSEYDGSPISGSTLYRAWTEPPHLPYVGFSPQLGRHWWACKRLLRDCRLVIEIGDMPFSDDGHGPIKDTVTDIIRYVIKPQLGHVDERTSEGYVAWILKAIRYRTFLDEYTSFLDEF